jgi:hypothetical protein
MNIQSSKMWLWKGQFYLGNFFVVIFKKIIPMNTLGHKLWHAKKIIYIYAHTIIKKL